MQPGDQAPNDSGQPTVVRVPQAAPRGNASAWYRQPETFIAFAALIVSVSAVVVGVYEASLQRAHDRAEVWPHLEVGTFKSPNGATISLANTGIGPAIVRSVDVTVNGNQARSWPDATERLIGHPTPISANTSVVGNALRPGDRITLVGLPTASMPADFWKSIARVRVTICYASVFGDLWSVTDTLGRSLSWQSESSCPAQLPRSDF